MECGTAAVRWIRQGKKIFCKFGKRNCGCLSGGIRQDTSPLVGPAADGACLSSRRRDYVSDPWVRFS